jgi:hypothetical protein
LEHGTEAIELVEGLRAAVLHKEGLRLHAALAEIERAS